MHETTPLFIGYKTLEEWLATRNPEKPILAMPMVEPGQDQGGIRTDTLLVMCQQIDGDGHVHYCRLRAASMTRCYGEPFDPDWQEREAAWQSLWEAVKEILQQHGLPFRGATVATPQRFRFLEAQTEGIAFDPSTKRFVRRAA
jgi:hypothetical protein